MRRFIGAILVTVVASGLNGSARADDAKDPQAILDKAIKALGGEEKLGKIKAVTWKTQEEERGRGSGAAASYGPAVLTAMGLSNKHTWDQGWRGWTGPKELPRAEPGAEPGDACAM